MNEQVANVDPSPETALRLLRGELSSRRRWFYRFVLLLSVTAFSLLVCLWVTEPEPFPPRLHIAFAAMCSIAAGWSGVLVWVLTRKNCPTAIDRIATSWMATLATSLSLVISVTIAMFREQWSAAIWLGVIGGSLVAIAVMSLRSAYQHRFRLRSQLEKLQQAAKSGTKLIVLCLLVMSCRSVVAQNNLEQKKIELSTRSGLVQADYGHLTVPMNRHVKSARTIKIAFIRIKGVDPQAKPTFVLAGGPGDSGIRIVKGMFSGGAERIQRVLPGDVIGIDQRGVGDSMPSLESEQSYGFPLETPGSAELYYERIAAACDQVANELRSQGIDLAAFNTRENADDIEALRAALGYEKVNLWGTSYGTHLGFALIRRYPNSIHRAMFCSPEGPDHTFKRPQLVDEALGRISKDTGGKLRPLMNRVIQRLEQEPIEVQVGNQTVGISAFDVRLMTWTAMGRIETTRRLVGLYEAMERDDYRFVATWLLRYRQTAKVSNVMKHLMDATSGSSSQRLTLIEQETGEHLLGDVINFPVMKMKTIWNVDSLGDDFRTPIQSQVPVLFVVGDLDARTPIENAKELMDGLPNAELFISKGAGHGFVPNPNVLNKIAAFFKS